ncbi:Hypothetical predicted protein [Mytilus galloprovincialis]|uniref:DZIP3-like HEPN domain-containing protein n=1 Tax=Mytilus galloprovincialis TaxID=29158 RepID=A0A8B6CCL8_MYTGA|nr:Hypothetical predicted protein [Mytilus galloprovincialis]
MATSKQEEDIMFLRLAGLLIRIAPRAVRRKFNYEFHSERLKQFLSKNRSKIDDLKNKKKVLTQAQYDILYPRGPSEVSSDMFDLSLMVCLLRHFTDQSIQDGLPMEHIQTIGSDISRIKFYRNYIVHSDCGKVNEIQFTQIWNCIVEAILRLTPDLKPEIDALMTSSLNSVSDVKDCIRLERELEITNQQMNKLNQKIEELEVENNNILGAGHFLISLSKDESRSFHFIPDLVIHLTCTPSLSKLRFFPPDRLAAVMQQQLLCQPNGE